MICPVFLQPLGGPARSENPRFGSASAINSLSKNPKKISNRFDLESESIREISETDRSDFRGIGPMEELVTVLSDVELSCFLIDDWTTQHNTIRLRGLPRW